MFSGSISKRKIDLSGSGTRKRQDRNAVVRMARKERAKRSRVRFNTHSLNRPDVKTKPIPTQKRRLEKAAVRIQSKWRAYQDLKRCRSKIRKDWDRKMGDLEKLVLMLESRGMSFSPPANTVFELLREFNFFDTSNRVSSTMTYDIDRVRKMCELVRKSMMSSVKNQNILALSQKSSSFSWKTQARHFILRLFPALLYLSDKKTSDLDIILNVLNCMFDSTKWPKGVVENDNLVDEILRSCVGGRRT